MTLMLRFRNSFHLLSHQQTPLVLGREPKSTLCADCPLVHRVPLCKPVEAASALFMLYHRPYRSSPFFTGSGVRELAFCTYQGVIRSSCSFLPRRCLLCFCLACCQRFRAHFYILSSLFMQCSFPFPCRARSCTPTDIRITHRLSFVFICALLLPPPFLQFPAFVHAHSPAPPLCALTT